MTPKQKAQELIEKYLPLAREHKRPMYYANKCALINVDEILKSEPLSPSNTTNYHIAFRQATDFWTNVKKELEK